MTIRLAERLLAFPQEERVSREELFGTFAALVVEKPLAALQRVKEGLENLPTVEVAASQPLVADGQFASELL